MLLAAMALHAAVLGLATETTTSTALWASGTVSLVLYGLLLHDEFMRRRHLVSPFTLYLLLSWLRLGWAPVYAAAVLDAGYGQTLHVSGHNFNAYLTQSLFVFLLGDWFFVAAYSSLRALAPLPRSLPGCASKSPGVMATRAAFALLAMGWGLRLASWAGVGLERLGQIHNFVNGYAIPAAILCLVYATNRRPRGHKAELAAIVVAVLCVEIPIQLASYMKQRLIVTVLPFFILLLDTMRIYGRRKRLRLNVWRLAGVATAGVAMLSVLFTYSQLRRPAFWQGRQMVAEKPPVMTYLQKASLAVLPGTRAFDEIHGFPKNGFWAFLNRNNMLGVAGFAMHYVKMRGTSNGWSYRQIPVTLIPRILWPGKPMIVPSREISVMLGQARNTREATNAVALGMAPAFYWNFGYPGLIVGMALAGAAFFTAWRVFSPGLLVNPIATMVVMSLYIGAIRWFESSFDGNLVYYILIFLFFYPLSILFQPRHARAAVGQRFAQSKTQSGETGKPA